MGASAISEPAENAIFEALQRGAPWAQSRQGLIDLVPQAVQAQQFARARNLLATAALLDRAHGSLKTAHGCVELFLKLPQARPADAASNQVESGLAMNCALVLDDVGDARAEKLWELAAALLTANPGGQAFCLAHAAGCRLRRGDANAQAEVTALIGKLRGATPGMIAGMFGAAGQSAGPAGVPWLAQAVWLMASNPAAYNSSTQPFLIELTRRVGAAHAIVPLLCGVSLAQTFHGATGPDPNQPAPERRHLIPGLEMLFVLVAKGRGVTPQQVAQLARAAIPQMGGLQAALQRLR